MSKEQVVEPLLVLMKELYYRNESWSHSYSDVPFSGSVHSILCLLMANTKTSFVKKWIRRNRWKNIKKKQARRCGLPHYYSARPYRNLCMIWNDKKIWTLSTILASFKIMIKRRDKSVIDHIESLWHFICFSIVTIWYSKREPNFTFV